MRWFGAVATAGWLSKQIKKLQSSQRIQCRRCRPQLTYGSKDSNCYQTPFKPWKIQATHFCFGTSSGDGSKKIQTKNHWQFLKVAASYNKSMPRNGLWISCKYESMDVTELYLLVAAIIWCMHCKNYEQKVALLVVISNAHGTVDTHIALNNVAVYFLQSSTASKIQPIM